MYFYSYRYLMLWHILRLKSEYLLTQHRSYVLVVNKETFIALCAIQKKSRIEIKVMMCMKKCIKIVTLLTSSSPEQRSFGFEKLWLIVFIFANVSIQPFVALLGSNKLFDEQKNIFFLVYDDKKSFCCTFLMLITMRAHLWHRYWDVFRLIREFRACHHFLIQYRK